MPTPGGIDVTHGSKGCLHPTRHLFQEDLEVGHFLLVDDNAASREEGVPVAVHQHALHRWLGEPRPLHARTSHAGQLQPSRAARAAPLAPVCSGEGSTPVPPEPTSGEEEEGVRRRGEGPQPPRGS
ncbi:PREDICTED: kidney-associated antigen 1 [Tauraco erythrolophus]|uniref:kidney-associated antigen 1 n=1 Tax=Tauraco erythrolophus TaxID=121530 RepID=UPI000523368B|nr:PREDICTED: kidney-associated antigen 1 [Tauraco erythrolophus]